MKIRNKQMLNMEVKKLHLKITHSNVQLDDKTFPLEDIPWILNVYKEKLIPEHAMDLAKVYNRLVDKRNISLEIYKNFFLVSDFPLQFKHELFDFFSYRVVEEVFLLKIKNNDWNGVKCVIRQFGGKIRIPLTLYDRFKFFCSINNLSIKKDIILPKIDYSIPEIDIKFNPEIKLRYYQKEAVSILLKNYSGIAALAGGLGKTVIMAKVIAESRVPTIIFINSIDIGLQLQDQFKRLLGQCGFIGAGKENWDVQSDINVCLIQTAYLALWTVKKIKKWIVIKQEEDELETEKDLEGDKESAIKSKEDKKIFQLIESTFKPEDYEQVVTKLLNAKQLLFDELDLVQGPSTYSKVSLVLPALFRRGFTATPFRNDYANLELTASTSEILYTKTMADGIQEGFLTPIWSFVIRLTQPLAKVGLTFPSIYKNVVIENSEPKMDMGLLIKYLVEQGFTRGFVLCSEIKQVNLLTKYFLQEDINVDKITGEEKRPLVRKQALERIVNGKTNVLVTTVMKRGIDIPNLDFVIRAYGLGKAKNGLPNTAIHQEMSRLTRLFKGKKKGLYFTFFYPFPIVSDHSKIVIAGIEQEHAGPIHYLTTDDLLKGGIKF